MKSIPLILAILLAIAWVYTSWYWYTCHIKWLCDGTNSSNRVVQNLASEPITWNTDSNVAENTPAEKLTIDDVIVVGDTSDQVEEKELEQTPEEEDSKDANWEENLSETT